MTVGEKITELRKQAGFTRTAFAEKLGIPQTTLRNYETDAREPGHSFLLQMAKQFHVSTDYILDLTDDPTPHADSDPTTLKPDELPVIKKYRRLSDSGKEYIDTQLDFALGIEKYRSQEQTDAMRHAALEEYRAHPPIIVGMAAFGGESSMQEISEEEHARRKALLEDYRNNK